MQNKKMEAPVSEEKIKAKDKLPGPSAPKRISLAEVIPLRPSSG